MKPQQLTHLPTHRSSKTSPLSDAIENDVQALQTQVAELHQSIKSISRALGNLLVPTPEQLATFPIEEIYQGLQDVLVDLRTMDYPAELTAWMNDARVQANRAQTRFNQGISMLQRWLQTYSQTRADQDYLGKARCCLNDTSQSLNDLLNHINDYLDEIRTIHNQHLLQTKATVLPFSTHPDVILQRGRQQGIREAIELIESKLQQGDDLLNYRNILAPLIAELQEMAAS